MSSASRGSFFQIPWRRLVLWAVLLALVLGAYAIWTPGATRTDGAHDLGHNGIWLQHGWIGDDAWFTRYGKEARIPEFRDRARVEALARRLRAHHIVDLFPHLAPTNPAGGLLEPDHAQLARFLDVMRQERVFPWIGGVYHRDVRADSPRWRARFIADAVALLTRHPRLAGVHLNIEPWPSGDRALLVLLEELRAALPPGKLLSVAASPPPVPVVGNHTVHWTLPYLIEVARRCDHLAVMSYDSGLKARKLYIALLARWTRQLLTATAGTKTEVLIGLPVYDDRGVPWHDPDVENLDTGLRGLHAGLADLAGRGALPAAYRGVALYADWEMDDAEWAALRAGFVRVGARP